MSKHEITVLTKQRRPNQASLFSLQTSSYNNRMMSVALSMWDAMSSWLTPMMLFLVLNSTIVTIFVTSKFSSHKQPPSPPHRPNKPETAWHQPDQLELHRSQSVLQRLKSVNFYQYANFYRTQEHAAPTNDVVQTQHTGFFYELPPQMLPEELDAASYRPSEEDYEAEDRFDREDEEEEEEETTGERSLDEVYSQLQRASNSHHRTKSDLEPASGAVAVKLVKKMKKSASSKSAFRHFKEAEILEARRPATVKESAPKTADPEDVEVDSKADDFINMFKHQLKLQRLDSILRYKEMLGRGAAK